MCGLKSAARGFVAGVGSGVAAGAAAPAAAGLAFFSGFGAAAAGVGVGDVCGLNSPPNGFLAGVGVGVAAVEPAAAGFAFFPGFGEAALAGEALALEDGAGEASFFLRECLAGDADASGEAEAAGEGDWASANSAPKNPRPTSKATNFRCMAPTVADTRPP